MYIYFDFRHSVLKIYKKCSFIIPVTIITVLTWLRLLCHILYLKSSNKVVVVKMLMRAYLFIFIAFRTYQSLWLFYILKSRCLLYSLLYDIVFVHFEGRFSLSVVIYIFFLWYLVYCCLIDYHSTVTCFHISIHYLLFLLK